MAVPHVIHQMWMQGAAVVPEKYAAARQSWVDAHPGWEVRTWSEADLVALVSRRYPSHAGWFKALPDMMQRCDVARGFVLHAFGGVYADMDSFAIQNFDGLCKEHARASTVPHLVLFTRSCNNAIMVSTRGNPFWMDAFVPAVRANAAEFNDAPRVERIIKTAGPRAMKALLNGIPQEEAARYGLVLLPDHVLEPWQLKRHRFQLTPDNVSTLARQGAYSYHASDTSWMGFSRDWVLLRFADTQTQVGTALTLALVAALLVWTGRWCVGAGCRLGKHLAKRKTNI